MLHIARASGMRIIGPNSMGVVNARNNFSTSFVSFDHILEGGLSLVSQTGLFIGAVLEWIISVHRLGINKSIDLANKCDVNEIDCLEYLMEDPFIEELVDLAKGFIHLPPMKGENKMHSR
jgi:acetyltransferase